MFGYDDIRDAAGIRLLFDVMHLTPLLDREIHVISIDEENDISILLDAAAFAQVSKLRYMGGPPFYGPTELGHRQYRHTQFPGQGFQGSCYPADFLHSGLVLAIAVYQLQIVDDNKVDVPFEVKASHLAPYIEDPELR